MAKMTAEKELELVYKALGNRADTSIWPSKMSAPAAVQRLVNTRNDEVLQAVAKVDAEWATKLTAAEELAESKEREMQQRMTKLENDADVSKKQVTDWINKYRDEQQSVTDMRNELETLNTAIDKAESLISSLETRLSDTRSNYEMEIDRNARLERELAEAKAESVFYVADRAKESLRDLRRKFEERVGLR
jgi:chromosome segregation ATPase